MNGATAIVLRGLVLIAVTCGLWGAGYWAGTGADGAVPVVPAPSLADRLNGACAPGYRMTDWSTTDELGRPLDGLVMVECSSVRADRYGLPVRVYRLAVAR